MLLSAGLREGMSRQKKGYKTPEVLVRILASSDNIKAVVRRT